MHTVQLLLMPSEYDKRILNKRFHALSHVHNVLVKYGRKCLSRLSRDPKYLSLREEYVLLLKKKTISDPEKARKKQLSLELTMITRSYGLSEYDLQSYIKVCAKQFRKCLSSQQIQKEATRVWNGIRTVLYGNGKALHFKKYRDFDTISGKSNTNGLKFCKETMSTDWLSLKMKCKLPKDVAYLYEALDAKISYCELKRMMFPNGWHYYIIIFLQGDAPRKMDLNVSKQNTTGVDIGTSTVAAVSDASIVLKELAPECRSYNLRIDKLQQYMDRSKRLSNPKKYNPDGTINRQNKDRWGFTKAYLKAQDRLKSLYRKKSLYITMSHEKIINTMLRDSTRFIVEDMSFKALQQKAKVETDMSEHDNPVKAPDHKNEPMATGVNDKPEQNHKNKRRKRFGRSMNNRAPARFISILARKAALYGGSVYRVDTKTFRASQYDHILDTYKKCSLSERGKYIDNTKVQRDLYSAFLLKNSNESLDHPDREKCIMDFPAFVKMQNELISELKENHVSMKQCFGF